VRVFGRVGEAGGGGVWTRHASGWLTADQPPAAGLAGELVAWPPPNAPSVQVEDLYERMAEGGYGYGPCFRGLRAAWRRGDDVFAEVVLPPEAAADAGSFGIHPALLDAALHAAALTAQAQSDEGDEPGTGPGAVRLPFAWTGVSVYASGAPVLRARLRSEAGGLSLVAADGAGVPVVSVESLVSRPVSAGQLEAAAGGAGALGDALFAVDWVPVPAVQAAAELPEVVLVRSGSGPETVRAEVARVLALVQEWLAGDWPGAARLMLVTRGAVAAVPGDVVTDLAGAAVCGLVRSAQSENPGRLVLADVPPGGTELLARALATGEPELAIRDGQVYARRLTRPSVGLAVPPGGVPWRLEAGRTGTLEGLEFAPCPQLTAPLEAGQVRVAVRAAGMNFRDVLIGLGMYPGGGLIGNEVAGLVLETGPQVSGLAPGDRVLGMAPGGFGPVAVTDARLLTGIPDGWSFARAAAVPIAFATAWYALVDLGGAQAGQRLLVHAAAGGVGMAAVAIGQHLGLEIYATASPGKHAVLTGLGLDEAHIASSRNAGFEDTFPAGLDIVLNSLAGELTDASLRLLRDGGTFLEMGKTDVRDPAQVAAGHPGVTYRSFDLSEAGPDRFGQIMAQVTALLAAGELHPPPVRAWDVRRAREAFRFMSQARHTGKLVLSIPPDPAARRRPGTALVTGGTGALGALAAVHLAATGRARALLLASRSGPTAPGAAALAADLAGRGAAVRVTACDAADRYALAAVLARIPDDIPLTTVVHTAAVLDDGVTGSLNPDRIDAVLRPKADAAWHLHQLTMDADLDAFVLFSSAAATFGAPGQGNYAAANASLDALAAARRAAGLPAVSLAWGLWAGSAGLTGHLDDGDRARMARGGLAALTNAQGLALLDAALGRDEAVLIPARLDLAARRTAAARGEPVSPLWHALIPPSGPVARSGVPGSPGVPAAPAVQGSALRQQLAALPEDDQDTLVLDLVRGHVATVLGHATADAIEPDRAFTDLGFDSLTAVELRNRLTAATGLQLPATLVFDYPAPAALARHLREQLAPEAQAGPDEDQLRQALASIPLARLREAGLLETLLQLAGQRVAIDSNPVAGRDIDSLDTESLVRLAFDNETPDD
jgi:NADPH:quinone reductase-like Zn-dependent oxidoreductase/acyl carrier protein